MPFCETCDDHRPDRHACYDAYLVWFDDDPESNAETLRASDEEDAAQKFVERYDEVEHEIANSMRGQRLRVNVRPVAGGPMRRMIVDGEWVALYFAYDLDDPFEDEESGDGSAS